jgi:hypothetical protein
MNLISCGMISDPLKESLDIRDLPVTTLSVGKSLVRALALFLLFNVLEFNFTSWHLEFIKADNI